MEFCFTPLREQDIEALTPIMRRAFDEDTRLHLGLPAGGPQGYDDGSFLRRYGLHPGATAYCIHAQGRLAGGVILWINDTDHCNTLGNLFLDPELQNRGLGTQVWREIERMFPDTLLWNTETPIYSHRNHNFYVNKCGFHIVHIDNPRDMQEGSFILQKVMRRGH